MRHLIVLIIIFGGALPLTAADMHQKTWQCTVYDNADNQWVHSSDYRKAAINKAYDACKKSSPNPRSCKAALEFCEAFVNGVSTRPMWRCTALDFNSKAFQSNIYTKKYDAALAAKAYCEDTSEVPKTCYINLATCANLNDWSE